MVFATVLFASYLVDRGFYPNVQECILENEEDELCVWKPVEGERYFSNFALACCLIFSLYLLPFLMRPIDAKENFKMHCFGLLAYWLTTPLFVSMFVIYSMSNLHDVTWGNRPTDSQIKASDNSSQKVLLERVKAEAKKTEDFRVFRTRFVLLWLSVNGIFFATILELVKLDDHVKYIDHDSGYLSFFAMAMACIVVFRITVAIIFIVRWKFRYNCMKTYKIKDVKKNIKRKLTGLVSKQKKINKNKVLVMPTTTAETEVCNTSACLI